MKTATDEDAVFGWQNRHLRKIAFLKGRPQSHSLGGPRALLPSSFVMNEFPGVAFFNFVKSLFRTTMKIEVNALYLARNSMCIDV